MVSEWATVRKPFGRGFPHIVVGYMRISTNGDRQVLDLQCDALIAAGVDERLSRTPDSFRQGCG
jgi:hypothetical protein